MSLQDAGQAHAFVTDLSAPALGPDDRHHFDRVLRLRPGAVITVADGQGSWRACRYGAELEPIGPVTYEAPVEPELGVAFALVKGDRPELVVQKLTELGIDVIVPFVAQRSVVRWDGRARRPPPRAADEGRPGGGHAVPAGPAARGGGGDRLRRGRRSIRGSNYHCWVVKSSI